MMSATNVDGSSSDRGASRNGVRRTPASGSHVANDSFTALCMNFSADSRLDLPAALEPKIAATGTTARSLSFAGNSDNSVSSRSDW